MDAKTPVRPDGDCRAVPANDWIADRLDALDGLLRRDDYRGHDPFDLTNSPLLRMPERWRLPPLLVSKFGSRIAPDWARRVLRVPLIHDPKTYVCAYFGYRALGADELAADMALRLADLATPTWGYDFTWPTRASGVSKRGASTLVPGAFAIFALADDFVRGGGSPNGPVIQQALDYYATEHLSQGNEGPFLGYFPRTATNTHNANVLGCAALSVGAALFQRDEWFELAAACADTTLRAVGDDGYLRYAEHRAADWTDCFHHLYTMASLLVIAQINPSARPEELQETVGRMRSYFRRAFLRSDDRLNYYPGSLHPVDPHNYAAAAVYATFFGTDEDIPPARAEELLRCVDHEMWSSAERRYFFRRHKHRLDRRAFLRWTSAWMFAALAVVGAGGIPGLQSTARGATPRSGGLPGLR